jgi:acetylornithine/N-succinyldiaminopimelate aminotransferase
VRSGRFAAALTPCRLQLLYDTQGKEYLDMSAGIAVSIVGHGDARISQAVTAQLGKVTHVSNLFHSEPPLALAERLVKMSPGFSQVFLCNSGTEANEGALKFARLAALAKRENRSRVIAFKSSFHGRSLGALSVTYKPAIRTPFLPLLNPLVDFCEFNDLARVEELMADDVMAIIVEPVQGEGGVNPAQPAFLKGAR